MATASSSWMPAQGRHNVGIGSSLAKALKARKGQPPQRNKNLPERDFYSLRYNHKPASIDPAKPGTLEVNPGREVTAVRVERPTTANNNEVVVFKGEEKPAKEWDCVLIYDEATQTFTLEKLDSHVNLNFDGKAQPRTRPTASPPAASTSTQPPQRSPARTAADELEALLEVGGVDTPDGDDDADADGEPDPNFLPPARAVEEELEDGEEEEGEVPLARTVQLKPTKPRARPVQTKAAPMPPPSQTQEPPAQQPSKTRPTPAVKKSVQTGSKARTSAAPTQTLTQAPTQPPKPPRAAKPPPAATATATTTNAPAKRAAASTATAERRHPDVEDFEIRGPIAPVSTTKRGSVASAPLPPPAAPPQSSSFSLALPTATSGPDPLAHASAAAAAESDDEWDEILAQPDRASHQQEPSLSIMIEDEADDGLDFLERELLGEDEPMVDVDGDGEGDVDADADGDADEEGDEDMEEMMLSMLEEVVPTPRAGGGNAGPISMNQFVGGSIAVEDEDDEYSSSEESDEE